MNNERTTWVLLHWHDVDDADIVLAQSDDKDKLKAFAQNHAGGEHTAAPLEWGPNPHEEEVAAADDAGNVGYTITSVVSL